MFHEMFVLYEGIYVDVWLRSRDSSGYLIWPSVAKRGPEFSKDNGGYR